MFKLINSDDDDAVGNLSCSQSGGLTSCTLEPASKLNVAVGKRTYLNLTRLVHHGIQVAKVPRSTFRQGICPFAAGSVPSFLQPAKH